MAALEDLILEKVRQLDEAKKREVLAFVERALEPEAKPFDWDAWWAGVEGLQAYWKEKYGEGYIVGALDLLDELREEASWPRF